MVTSVSQVLHLGGYRQWRNRRLETSWSQKQVTRKAVSKVAPKTASKFQLQNTSLPDEVETALGCQASLLGSFSPSGRTGYATRSSGSSHAEQELTLPAWSVQLRLVHQSQTCWAGSGERKLLRAQSRPGEYPPPICSFAEQRVSCQKACLTYALLSGSWFGAPSQPLRSTWRPGIHPGCDRRLCLVLCVTSEALSSVFSYLTSLVVPGYEVTKPD